jgi:hypothetical protein
MSQIAEMKRRTAPGRSVSEQKYLRRVQFVGRGSLEFPMLRLAMAVGALLLAVAYAQAQTAKHSFSGLCAYYPGRGGGLTAAHKTLPFGTRVRVTDSKTGRSVIVVINDRGPFNKGRVLDLSTAAAKALDMMERGVVLVRADVL